MLQVTRVKAPNRLVVGGKLMKNEAREKKGKTRRKLGDENMDVK